METTITKQTEAQAQDLAKKVMSMNRHERRAFAKLHGTEKIYGSNKPIRNSVDLEGNKKR